DYYCYSADSSGSRLF
nr:immunoglobulin light chain junction region [Macaca mulatta]MOX28931.1 immunoglobulin light chain junction region [Macaca mulatta]MOX29003.1 immunoglobulin light chain junction region [Macaca mulatta]MOX29670.1 immunoglobulin light chain junction region [Macaca mulatta]MOX29835.1 immunoglobulin light chain junction region [Macaca mulatta]